MPSSYYFQRPTNQACHDLTTVSKPPKNVRSLLGLGLQFCPRPRYTTHNPNSTISRLKRDLWIRHFFGENNTLDGDFNPRLHFPSEWIPPDRILNRSFTDRFYQFASALRRSFLKRKSGTGLLRSQTYILNSLQASQTHVVCKADKNLGPCIIERTIYVQRALHDHLLDTTTYRPLSLLQATSETHHTKRRIEQFLHTHKKSIKATALKFLLRATSAVTDATSKFYLTFKIHKTPWKTRPIVSTCGSLTHPLGIWLDLVLQPPAQAQPSYIQSSFTLKKELDELPALPPGAMLLTSDATSMYTNIGTNHAIRSIRPLLSEHYSDNPSLVTAIIDGLRIAMTRNVIQFGDTHWLQIDGTAMGIPPACAYATLYYAAHEKLLLAEFDELLYYRRYIDDIFAIWLPPAAGASIRWHQFTSMLNSFGKLRWTTTPLSTTVNFLDLTLTIENSRISCCMYEKEMNLYLYISPRSCHPPGVLYGLIVGNFFRIYTLCSKSTDRRRLLNQFFRRLRRRGFRRSKLLQLFQKALSYTMSTRPSASAPGSSVFLHVPYHPSNPPSHKLQHLWKTVAFQPPGRPALNAIPNFNGSLTPIDRLIVAYSRPHNLGNLLSYRKIDHWDGPPVSSFLD